MIEVTHARRQLLARILVNVGSIVFGAIVVGRFLPQSGVGTTTFIAGLLITLLAFYAAFVIINHHE